MPNSEVNEPQQTDRLVDRLWKKRAEVLWGLVIVTLLLTFVSPVVLIGAGLVIATMGTAWAGFHELLDRAKQDDADSPATPLRLAQDRPSTPEKSPTHAPWQGHSAA